MAQKSHPKDSGRVNGANEVEPDRKFTTRRRLEHQRGSRGSGGLSGPPHLQPPAPGRHSPSPRVVATEPKLDREMAQKVENYAAEVTKLRRELEAERRRNSTPPLVQGTISFSVESEERTLEVNASTRTSKERQVDEDRTTENDVRDDNSTVTLARVYQSTDPPAKRSDSRIMDGSIHEVSEYDSSFGRAAREHEFKEPRPPGLELSQVPCGRFSETWTGDSEERVAGVAQPKDPPSRRSSLYMESESSDTSEFEFEELRPPDPDLTLDKKGGVRQASSSFDVWMDLARGQFHRERSAMRETEMRKGKVAERDEVRPSVAGTLGSVQRKLSFEVDLMMSGEADRSASGGRKSKMTRT
ncbi:uncharacterized protein EI90DRAFT_3104490 [Cantharellus anzutake]|uniref:uncharacterized protein n=1 Tax=Cantharellus anzutake TaxID=1750568 RepID=UPI0019082AF7|nr:uncharacterized protein EI90DRAFT_3104490 [Cantharellus anzutake]KAF8309608.1 hypothetical protein EI90DRAFT_3104490 [Cantharellus anzutake]